jgi:hypothetical protein
VTVALMFKDMVEQVNDIVLSVVSFQRLHAKKIIPLPLRITGILGLGIYYLIDGIRDYKLMSFLLST